MSLTLNVNHIAIRGSSFCGSTVLSYVLGCLNGCENIGESHWITSSRRLSCLRCKDDCKVITEEFRQKLSNSQYEWYDIIRLALGAKCLISSDKEPEILERLDPFGKRAELVLFKNPVDNLISYVKVTGESILDCYEIYFENWVRIYSVKYDVEPSSTRYLLFNDFIEYPDLVVRRIAEAFFMDDVGFKISIDKWWLHHHHSIGGNFDPYDDENIARRKLNRSLKRENLDVPVEVFESNSYLDAINLYSNILLDANRIVV